MTEGYLSEIFSSYQGEGGSIIGSTMGRRQIFIRLAGCNIAQGEFETSGCEWCDSPEAKFERRAKFRIEKVSGSLLFEFMENPITPDTLLNLVKEIETPDLHSISFTGGEPTIQPEFLIESATILKNQNKTLFLETNGATEWKPGYAIFDYFSIDLKDQASGAAKDWKDLVEKELQFGEKALRALRNRQQKDIRNIGIYFKLVITKKSDPTILIPYIQKISQWNNQDDLIQANIVVQPVSPTNNFKDVPSFQTIMKHTQEFAKILGPKNICISLQMHKYMNIL
jgi:7-carboxy-7-deazaguanine synthase